MSSLSKSGLPRWPSWAGGGGFRRRAGSAITHPATVAALGLLLLNDLLFKALWPHSWLTGKLSDLAWLVFALPLLAFLLSFAARRNVRAGRLAFLAAYVGLPVLYAAFNTFEPVHDVIMRGISLAGGAAGSPRDATDSLVIPLAWGAALWVWRREPAAPGAMRLRWAVLVAGVAALASVASSPQQSETLHGVQHIGVSEDGAIVAVTSTYLGHVTHRSVNGGVTWSPAEYSLRSVTRGGNSVDTPRGHFMLDGPRVLRIGTDGTREEVVYSTEYLEEDGNVWVQKVSTEKFNQPRKIASRPVGIVYDDSTGNVVIAMGIQGVVVGFHDGKWHSVAVDQFGPTDYSFVSKTGLLVSDLEFWTAALALCVSMTSLGLTASQYRLGELLRTVAILVVSVCAVAGMVVGPVFVSSLIVQSLLISLVLPLTVILVPLAFAGAAVLTFVARRGSRAWRFATMFLSLFSILASGALMFLFGFSDDSPNVGFFRYVYVAVAAAAWSLGALSLTARLRHMVKRWRLAALSLTVMTALVFLTFMLWLHLGVDEVVTKAASIALCGIAAIVLANYAARTTSTENVVCAACGRHAMAQDTYCINCGAQLVEGWSAS